MCMLHMHEWQTLISANCCHPGEESGATDDPRAGVSPTPDLFWRVGQDLCHHSHHPQLVTIHHCHLWKHEQLATCLNLKHAHRIVFLHIPSISPKCHLSISAARPQRNCLYVAEFEICTGHQQIFGQFCKNNHLVLALTLSRRRYHLASRRPWERKAEPPFEVSYPSKSWWCHEPNFFPPVWIAIMLTLF